MPAIKPHDATTTPSNPTSRLATAPRSRTSGAQPRLRGPPRSSRLHKPRQDDSNEPTKDFQPVRVMGEYGYSPRPELPAFHPPPPPPPPPPLPPPGLRVPSTTDQLRRLSLSPPHEKRKRSFDAETRPSEGSPHFPKLGRRDDSVVPPPPPRQRQHPPDDPTSLVSQGAAATSQHSRSAATRQSCRPRGSSVEGESAAARPDSHHIALPFTTTESPVTGEAPVSQGRNFELEPHASRSSILPAGRHDVSPRPTLEHAQSPHHSHPQIESYEETPRQASFSQPFDLRPKPQPSLQPTMEGQEEHEHIRPHGPPAGPTLPVKRAGAQQQKQQPKRKKNNEGDGGQPDAGPEPGAPPAKTPQPQPQWEMSREPDTLAIPADRLQWEIGQIHKAVVELEEECRDKVAQALERQIATADRQPGPPAPGEQVMPTAEQSHHFRILIGSHRQLCQEYYDLFRATQYATTRPDVSPELGRFARDCGLSARLWKNGVHGLLELMRRDLPHSQEYLHAYVFLAYQLYTLLLETVDDFQDSWLECLGDLSRYRMAVEYENPRERELWLETADRWYTKSSMRQPHLGRVLHHRAILARRNGVFPQLNLYARALTAPEPFDIARQSMRQTILGAALTDKYLAQLREAVAAGDARAKVVDNFVLIHALNLHRPEAVEQMQQSWNELASALQAYIGARGPDFGFEGETMALVNIASLFQWNVGTEEAPVPQLRRVFDAGYRPASRDEALAHASELKHGILAMWYQTMGIYALALRMVQAEQAYALVHVVTAFLYCLATARSGYGLLYFGGDVHWKDLATFLNAALRLECADVERLRSTAFIHAAATEVHILPEDKSMRGLAWTKARSEYLAPPFFALAPVPEEEMKVERASNASVRRERILWLGMQIAQVGVSDDGGEAERHMLEGKPWLRFEAAGSGEPQFVVR